MSFSSAVCLEDTLTCRRDNGMYINMRRLYIQEKSLDKTLFQYMQVEMTSFAVCPLSSVGSTGALLW